MIRVVVVSVDPGRVVTMERIYPKLEVFEGVTGCGPLDFRQQCIPKTYQKLAAHAVKQGWGRETVVVQDDVLLSHGPGLDLYNASFDTELLIFGKTETSGKVAPKAFSASPEMWVRLKKVWDGKGRIVPAWMPLVKKHGLVLDVTKDLGGRYAPCAGCRKH